MFNAWRCRMSYVASRAKLIDKVKALLSKTRENGCTFEEELVALSKASEMVAEHQVTEEELGSAKLEEAIIHLVRARDARWVARELAFGVSSFTGCEVMCRPVRARSRRSSSLIDLVFVGLRSDVELAEWLIGHLTHFVQSELKSYLESKKFSSVREKNVHVNGFCYGATSRISERLTPPKLSGTGRELAVVKNAAVEEAMRGAGIVTSVVTKPVTLDTRAKAAGAAAGDRATFTKELQETLAVSSSV